MADGRGKRSAITRSETDVSLPARGGSTPFHANAWRNVLATGVASAALFAYSGRPVRAQAITPPNPPCNTISGIGGSIVTCTGDLSPGVDLSYGGGPYAVLNVTNLTTNITPASGVTGVLFTSNGAVELNVDTGPFAIFATDAEGIFASSNGGSVTIASTADVVTTGGGAVGVQGSAQNAPLTITSSGNIATSGNNSFGIAGGTVYGDIVVNSSGNIATSGTFAAGINVGSIGIFGTTQGAITITSSGDIVTSGSSAIGINASTVYGPIDITSLGDIAVSGAASIGINAQTQGGVEITSSGNIAAGPDSSVGILALSQDASVLITSTGDIATAGHSGIGIYARAGQMAAVYASGSITTLGDDAPGIAASGYAGTVVVSTGAIRTSGDDAPGITAYGSGDVAVVSSGDITTTGDTSDGISVVSTSGMAAVVNMGRISATGAGSAGIYAAGDSGSNVINFGAITGCPCGGVILLSGTGDNNLVNFGTIISVLTGSAIEMDTFGANLVENFGTVTGNVMMAGATGVFENRAGALFNSGDDVMADVSNAGTLAPGGTGAVETTDMIGALTQSGTGTFAVDIAGGLSDQMIVSDTASLAGNVAVRILSLPTLAAYTILQSDAVTDNGLALVASPALHATLQFTATDVILGISVGYVTDGLNPNQRAIATNLDQILAAGVGDLGPVLLGLLNVGDLAGYQDALNQLSPELYSDAQIAALYSTQAFAGSLLSCRVNGTDTASIIREGQCLWAGASARFLDAGTTSDQIGFEETAGLFTAGAQAALDKVWRLGVAGGFQSSTMTSATGATSEGSLGQAGIALKYNPGALLLAGALTGGGATYDTRRPMAFGGFTGLAEGDQTLGIFSGTLRAAYVLGSPDLYFKPVLDATVTQLQLGSFTEGGGPGALSVEGGGHTLFALAPSLEAGTEWWLGNGTLMRPSVRGGVTWYANPDFAMSSSFVGAPLGVSPFTINTDVDQAMALIGVGLEVVNGGDAALRVNYDGQIGETTQIHSVGIKGSARF